MTNLHILAGAIPATSLLLQELEANDSFNVHGAKCYDDVTITKIEDIKTVEQARACTINLVNAKTKKHHYVPLGSYLGFPSGDSAETDDTVYSKMAQLATPVFTTAITIVSCEPLVKNAKPVYPYKAYKGYQKLLENATTEYNDLVTESKIDTDKFDNATRYLFGGKFVAELAKLRAGVQTTVLPDAKPYHVIVVK